MYANINNECRFDGNLTKDPELSYIPYGQGKQMAKCKFSVTVPKNMTKEQKERAKAKGEYITDIIPCEITGPKAEVIANNFVKGKPIKVTTVFRTFNYTNKQGEKVYSYTFDVVDFGFATQDFSEGFTNNQAANNSMNKNFNYGGTPYDGMIPVDEGSLPF